MLRRPLVSSAMLRCFAGLSSFDLAMDSLGDAGSLCGSLDRRTLASVPGQVPLDAYSVLFALLSV